MTFWHWSGVTPYTSSYEFAGSCVFDKQLPGKLSLRPAPSLNFHKGMCGHTKIHFELFCLVSLFYFVTVYHFLSIKTKRRCRQALSRSYGCFFAEFLGEQSLVRLSLLDLTTCVGLRYGFHSFMLRSFSRKLALSYPLGLPLKFSLFLKSPLKVALRIYQENLLKLRTQIQ